LRFEPVADSPVLVKQLSRNNQLDQPVSPGFKQPARMTTREYAGNDDVGVDDDLHRSERTALIAAVTSARFIPTSLAWHPPRWIVGPGTLPRHAVSRSCDLLGRV
jgi:hypothetical protein